MREIQSKIILKKEDLNDKLSEVKIFRMMLVHREGRVCEAIIWHSKTGRSIK